MTLPYGEMLLRLTAAIVLGGAIGYERELREQAAGLRTHLLVALAAATFGLVSYHAVSYQNYPTVEYARMDLGRLASNVAVGIGFLGGGAIVHSGLTTKGLTTAASLWLVAAVGLAAGAGMVLLAATVTLLCLFALVVLRVLIEEPQKRIVRLKVQLDLAGDFVSRARLSTFLSPVGAVAVTALDYERDRAADRSRLWLEVRLAHRGLEEPLVRRLETLDGLRSLKVEHSD